MYKINSSQLTQEEKEEAEIIVRRLFGCYDWQGVLQEFPGTPGLVQYINRVVVRKIRPAGASWLVGEQQFLDEDGYPMYEPGLGFSKSVYYIKKF